MTPVVSGGIVISAVGVNPLPPNPHIDIRTPIDSAPSLISSAWRSTLSVLALSKPLPGTFINHSNNLLAPTNPTHLHSALNSSTLAVLYISSSTSFIPELSHLPCSSFIPSIFRFVYFQRAPHSLKSPEQPSDSLQVLNNKRDSQSLLSKHRCQSIVANHQASIFAVYSVMRYRNPDHKVS